VSKIVVPASRSLLIGPFALLVAAAGCAHNAPGGAGSPSPWVDASVVGDAAAVEAELNALEAGDAHDRVVRLERLLDLFDAARFSGDDDARETLWNSLGGHATGVGTAATRDAQRLLLAEAMALSDGGEIAPDDRDFVAAVIQLLTTDLQTPATADDLVLRTLAYRTLVEQGHARVVDNARWRLYDHARGTLQGATEAAPEERLDIAVQALYADRESVEAWLADAAPHAKPPAPGIDQLWSMVSTQTQALATDQRWRPVVAARAPEDDALAQTLAASLPAPRVGDWPLVTLPAGTAAAESGAPILRLSDEGLVVDDGRPTARTVALASADDAIRRVLAQDGRGLVLWVADPVTPAPRVAAVLDAVAKSGAAQLELAVYEPRLRPDAPPAVLALPLAIVHTGEDTPGAAAALAARITMHLAGAGSTVTVDGRTLPPATAARDEGQLDAVAAAYPRERVVTLAVGSDVQVRQLVDLLAEVRARGFAAAAWHVDGSPAASPDATAVDLVQRRAALGRVQWRVTVAPPFPLKEDEIARIEAFVQGLDVCMPELQVAVPRKPVALSLPFEDAALGTVTAQLPRGVDDTAREAFDACIATRGRAFRLRHHRDTMTVVAELSP
jgi:hypothetical protein